MRVMRKVAVGVVVLLWLAGSGWAVWHYYGTTPKSPDSTSTDAPRQAGPDVSPTTEGVVVVVPDVVGREAMPAALQLQQKRLGITIVRSSSIAVPERIVIAQDPAAGTEVPSGTEVELTISTGPP
jgi:hypothetical protein